MIIGLVIGCLLIAFLTKTITMQYLLGMILAVATMQLLIVNAKRIYLKAVYYAPLILVPVGSLIIVYFLVSNCTVVITLEWNVLSDKAFYFTPIFINASVSKQLFKI